MPQMNDAHTRLTDVFRNVFDDDALVLRKEMTADDVENWDSLTHINLIVALEKEFRIRFTTSEVSGLKNVGELEALVESKVQN
jgi:acyl carrier protein